MEIEIAIISLFAESNCMVRVSPHFFISGEVASGGRKAAADSLSKRSVHVEYGFETGFCLNFN